MRKIPCEFSVEQIINAVIGIALPNLELFKLELELSTYKLYYLGFRSLTTDSCVYPPADDTTTPLFGQSSKLRAKQLVLQPCRMLELAHDVFSQVMLLPYSKNCRRIHRLPGSCFRAPLVSTTGPMHQELRLVIVTFATRAHPIYFVIRLLRVAIRT